MSNPIETVRDNFRRVVDEVAEAAISAGRQPVEVSIVGVTKYVDANTTRLLVDAGCASLGESRPQSLWDKAEQLSDLRCQWHLIGHLQRNKVRRTLPLVSLVHSIDSLRLAESVSQFSSELALVTSGLLEVNVSGDADKHGFALQQVEQSLSTIAEMKSLRIVGLMAMSGLNSSLEQAEQEFCKVRDLRDRLVERGLPEGVLLDELSMGMSGDFPQAIRAGATIVRVGSRLFDGI